MTVEQAETQLRVVVLTEEEEEEKEKEEEEYENRTFKLILPSVLMCFVCFNGQLLLYIELDFITEEGCVYCAVQTFFRLIC
jgi:hypothetical protein